MGVKLVGKRRGKHPSGHHRNHHAAERWDRGAADAESGKKFWSGTHCPACIIAYNEGYAAGKSEADSGVSDG